MEDNVACRGMAGARGRSTGATKGDLHVLCIIDSLAYGGAERSLAALTPYLTAHGVRLDVAYLNEKPGLHEELRAGGATLFRIVGSGGRLGWVARGAQLVRTRRPDLVHTTLFDADVTGRLAALIGRVPVVSSLVNVAYGPEMFDDPNLRRWRLRSAQLLDRLTARGVVRFHAITAYLADLMAPRLGINPARIDVVPRGRDAAALGLRTSARAERARQDVGAGDGPLVVAAARQEPQKGLDFLVRAWPAVVEAVPGAQLIVAGREGRHTATLRALCAESGVTDAIRFLGAWPRVPDLLSAADVFVLPSRWEGLGSVLLEAMALDAPIVASDLPPVRETVGDESRAWLVRPEEPVPLANAIIEALLDRPTAVGKANAAHARFAERFTIDRVGHSTLAFYERALSSARK